MLAAGPRHDPADRRQVSIQGILLELGIGHDMLRPELRESDMGDGVERRPDIARLTLLRRIVPPAVPFRLQAIGQRLEVKARGREALHPFFVHHLHVRALVSVAAPLVPAVSRVVDRASGLRAHRV